MSRKRKVAQVKWCASLLMGYSEELTLNARAWGVLSGLALLAHLLFGPAEKRATSAIDIPRASASAKKNRSAFVHGSAERFFVLSTMRVFLSLERSF